MDKEYIEREIVLSLLSRNSITKHITFADDVSIYDAVKSLPTADVVEIRHGKWISASQKKGVNIGMKCSLCGARIKYSEFFNGNHNFCHKCGAKMDGKDK